MRFIKRSSRGFKLDSYFAYVAEKREAFPANALAFAAASWHYDIRDSKCPHDSWLEELIISESARGAKREIRNVQITMRLLGAYHDGLIEIRYRNVIAYSFSRDRDVARADLGARADRVAHGDWIVDEITLNEDGSVLHEIEFEMSGPWAIRCADIVYGWIPTKAD